MDLEVKIVKPRFLFGPENGDDIYFKTEVKFGIKKHGEMNYLLFDHLKFETAFDFEVIREVAIANFKYMTFKKAGDPIDRVTPLYDSMEMTSEQYSEFWSYLDMRMERWLAYFNNEVFSNGVPLPYWNLQFLTKLTFHPRAMLVVMDLFYNV